MMRLVCAAPALGKTAWLYRASLCTPALSKHLLRPA